VDYSMTDRQERTYPDEMWFPYRTRACNEFRRYLPTDRNAPKTVVERSALVFGADGNARYARKLLGAPRGDRRRAPKPVTTRMVTPTKPGRKLTPQEEYERAMKELAKANAEVEKANAALARLNK
jgi:hypothetical protein